MGFYKIKGSDLSAVDEAAILESEGINVDEYLQECVYIEFSQLPDDKLKQFLESSECREMQEAGIIGKKTMVRLSKADDLTRRVKMAAIQIGKDKEDRLFKLWDKGTQMAKDAEEQLLQKYNMMATKLARVGQKDYLKSHKMASVYSRA